MQDLPMGLCANLIAEACNIGLARWGGAEVASADGLRFVVPVPTLNAGPNPKYCGFERGVTSSGARGTSC
jgi:TnpA family transposase